MNYKIVTDSSANVLSIAQSAFSSVPLHIIVGDQDFVDDADIDLEAMQQALSSYKGKSSTACPSPSDWITAFEEADAVFCTTITSTLSGSYSSAHTAKQIYESEHPGRKVYVLDSLSTGPEITLLIEKLQELIQSGMPHEKIYQAALDYMKHTRLLFSLASVDNLARNGRVNPLLAKGVGLLGIRLIGEASAEGTLSLLDKSRGDKRAIPCLIRYLKQLHYHGGKIIIAHNHNLTAAHALKNALVEEFGIFNGYIHETRGLCSYYAEPQSLIVGFEI